MKSRLIDVVAVLCTGLFLLSATATAQQVLVTKALTEKKVSQLPARPLFWRVENFPTLAQAEVASGPYGLVAGSGGKVWLFTLGSAGGSPSGGAKVVDLGPLPMLLPSAYALRVHEATGPP